MRSSKMIFLALAIPAVVVFLGVGHSASAAIIPFGKPTCANVLCPAGTQCVDSKDGPRCVPGPGPIGL